MLYFCFHENLKVTTIFGMQVVAEKMNSLVIINYALIHYGYVMDHLIVGMVLMKLTHFVVSTVMLLVASGNIKLIFYS